MQLLTINALGITPPSVPNDPAYSDVRVGWQQLGQPAQTVNQDVAYVRSTTVNDAPVNRVRDVQWIPNPQDDNDPPISMIHLYTYMRVWETFWEFYGPNSFDRARMLHSSLFTQLMHDTFAAAGLQLYWVTDASCPRRVPYYSDSQWWERCDFEARFNELVTEAVIVPIAASVEVKIYTDVPGPGGLGTSPLGTQPLGEDSDAPNADFVVELQAGTGLGTSPLGTKPLGE